ncbi:hemolysin D [Sphingomonas sp. Leaf357]|uniref:efflux RND transporter periplasmic adaptor subunit n=1 Tax=Sphingomonas sp. Leaf357 TaxID=1736350 RepID=UPI0006F4B46F|nr:efflux RND transporter periplasmic adaptor subunit [Sphingomonas sp. Leaf357]KQS02120.1 hemolysin D [Sphingomonas sp. Leaf357]
MADADAHAQPEADTTQRNDDHPAPPTAGKRRKLLTILAIVVAAAACLWAIWYFVFDVGRVHTDNAYVGADSAQITSLVSGPVTEVRVGGTQAVKKGDILVVIDSADAKIDLATAQAALLQAQQKYGQTAALAGSARSKVTSRGADIAQARAKLADANAMLARTKIDLDRRQQLVGSGAASAEELTTARAAYQSALASRQLAQAGVTSAIATQNSAGDDAAASEALVRGTTIDTSPDVASARARLDKAKLDLERTVIRAPVDGIVTNRQVQVGQRIAAGAPIMTIVPIATAYVDANYKESQLRDVRIGQPAELTSDYYGGDVVFHGHVTGFSGGTGAAFSLIPAQNATGNWVKVVQRLPVRITIDPKDLQAHPLRVGLTMDAVIDTRGK